MREELHKKRKLRLRATSFRYKQKILKASTRTKDIYVLKSCNLRYVWPCFCLSVITCVLCMCMCMFVSRVSLVYADARR